MNHASSTRNRLLRRRLGICAWLLILASPAPADQAAFTLAFGSCLKQDRPAPVLPSILDTRADLFVFAGDSLYINTQDVDALSDAYQGFASGAFLRRLRADTRVLATWDDNDYGANDAGADYPLRTQVRRLFLDTFQVSKTRAVWSTPGIYDAYRFSHGERQIQILLLDTRSFRSPLDRNDLWRTVGCGPYGPVDDPHATVLGERQWAWLEDRLAEPADLRVIVSSIQVIPDQHCWEKWGNFPHERQRLFKLIRDRQAAGVVLISGDRHFADISRLPADQVGYPLYEVTASGLNNASGRAPEANRFRAVGASYSRNHFGLIILRDDTLHLQIRDEAGKTVLRQTLALADLQTVPKPSSAVLDSDVRAIAPTRAGIVD